MYFILTGLCKHMLFGFAYMSSFSMKLLMITETRSTASLENSDSLSYVADLNTDVVVVVVVIVLNNGDQSGTKITTISNITLCDIVWLHGKVDILED